MALVDLLDRSTTITVSGRTFTVRPVSVFGMLRAQELFSDVATASSSADAPYSEMQAAVASGDAEKAVAALARFYLSLFDELGRDRLAALLALVATPSDAGLIATTLDDPNALAVWLSTVGELHDIPRLLRKWIGVPSHGLPVPLHVAESDDVGLETVILDVAMALPSYSLRDLLDWPYERLLTVVEQIAAVRSLRAGEPATTRSRPVSGRALAASGFAVQMPRAKKSPEVH